MAEDESLPLTAAIADLVLLSEWHVWAEATCLMMLDAIQPGSFMQALQYMAQGPWGSSTSA